ncbi:MAG: crosslink repair DNA glycosylase YcaQ family protein [Planctomycetota bacterium]
MPPALDEAQLRAVRIVAQRFGGGAKAQARTKTPDSLGYVRTLGGADAYLAARARIPGLTRGNLEALVAEEALRVVPAVRGCIYLVPAADAALCLRTAHAQSATRDARDAERAGIRKGELDNVAAAVLESLRSSGPETTDGLRRRLPDGTLRSLGERGKKAGVSSALPPALRQLEFAGKIARLPVEGRLDHEKYVWRPTTTDPFAAADLPCDNDQLHGRLLTRFLGFAGASDLGAFCAWSGLTQRDAKAALPHAEFVPVNAKNLGAGAMASAEIETLLRRAERAADAIAFLPFEDNLVHLTGGLSPFVVEEMHNLSVPTWGKGKTMQPLGSTRHAMFRSILADGRIRGFWEYDPDASDLVTHLFDPPAKPVRTAIEAAATETATFLREQIGHGRSFSLDSDDELRRRVAQLRKMTRAR